MMETKTAYDQIVAALQYLDERCDGAHAQDGQGFNGRDAHFGKDLAARSRFQELTSGQLHAALKMLQTYKGQLDKGGLTLPDDFEVTPKPTFVVADAPRQSPPSPRKGSIKLEGGDMLIIAFPYDAVLVEKVKTLKTRSYDPQTRTWHAPRHLLFEVLAMFPGFDVDPKITEELEAIKAQAAAEERQKEEARLAREREVELLKANLPDFSQPLPNGWMVFKHQSEGVTKMIEWGHAILADDMGLGKTLEALLAAQVYQKTLGCHIFVLSPKSIMDGWKRTAAALGVRIEVFSWAKIPEPVNAPYVLIADEAHYAQTMGSKKNPVKRTAGFLKLAEQAKAVYPCTGTPMKNGRPAGIFPLLLACKHHLASDRHAFEKHFCNAGPTAWSRWDVTGAAHLDELYREMQDVMIRRLKKDCLDLPEKMRVKRGVELSKESEKEYNEKLRELKVNYSKRLQDGLIQPGGEALVEMGQYRLAGSIAKIETANEIAEEVLEQQGQIAIFTEFKESAERIAAHIRGAGYGCELLTGEATHRELMVDRFQNGTSQAFVGTIKAGGVGITLTRANTVVLVDRPWTPGDAEQAEDRTHRIGQTGTVTAIWLQLGEMDETIDDLLEAKQGRIELALEGKRKTMRGLKSIGEVANHLLPELLNEIK